MKILLKKSARIFRKKIKKMLIPYAEYRIKHFNSEKVEINVLINFIFNKFFGLIQPAQVKSEITSLAELVKKLKPKTVLEIGTANGGTLFLFSRLADPSAKIISIDLPGGDFGGGYPEWKINLYKSFPLLSQQLYLLRENSHSASTLEQVKEIIGTTPVDFLFIDGDHTYEGAKKDFDMYSPLVKEGGIIALHDIARHPPEKNCNVRQLWEEIKKDDSEEFIENPNQKWAGIGVYRKS